MTVVALPAQPDMSQLSAVPPDALGGSTITVTALDHFEDYCTGGATPLQRRDTLLLEANHAFVHPTTHYEINHLTGDGWAAIRSTMDASLPPRGTRIVPASHSVFMPKIQKRAVDPTGGGIALMVRLPCAGLRWTGLEICSDPVSGDAVLISALGWDTDPVTPLPRTPDQDGHRYFVDRCYVHGAPPPRDNQSCGISINGWDIRITDTVITNIQGSGGSGDTGALKTSSSRGIHHVENCFLAGSGMSVFYGGGTFGDEAHIPKDLRYLRNTMAKLTITQGNPANNFGNHPDFVGPSGGQGQWNTKPLFELKAAVRVLCEGNTMENSWNWPCFTIDVHDQFGGDPTVRAEDITIRYNYMPRDGSTFGTPPLHGSLCPFQLWAAAGPIRRVHFHDNLAWATYTLYATQSNFGNTPGNAYYHSIGGGSFPHSPLIEDLLQEHNTIISDRAGGTIKLGGSYTRIKNLNNIVGYGHGGNSIEGLWTGTDAEFASQITDFEWVKTAFVDFDDVGRLYGWGARSPAYSDANWSPSRCATGEYIIPLPSTPALAGIDQSTGQLVPGGRLDLIDAIDHAGTHRKIGVDFAALAAAMAGAGTPFLPRVPAGRAPLAVF